MARNMSGVYSLPAGSIVTDGTTIEISQHNTPLQDLATDANTARPVVAGGTGATTASGARTNLGVGEYTEGTFTPVIADAASGGNEATAAVSVGHYVKVGRHVTLSIYFEDIDTTGLTGGNDIFITGMPFTSRNLSASRYTSIARTDNIDLTGAAGDAYAYLTQAVSYLRLGINVSGTASDFLTVSDITSGTANLYVDLTYIAE